MARISGIIRSQSAESTSTNSLGVTPEPSSSAETRGHDISACETEREALMFFVT